MVSNYIFSPFIQAIFVLDFEENNKKLQKHNSKSTLAPRESITESEVLCEYCKKSFAPEKILKHIGHVKACKTFYGPRFDELKKEQQRKRIVKFNPTNLSDKQQQNILKRNRERYAKSSEKKQKKHENAEKRKQKKLDQIQTKQIEEQEKNGEKINLFDFVEDETGKEWQCDFCKTFWPPASILKHIGNVKNCKSHYGSKFDDLKKDHKRQSKQFYRKKEGTEKELEQQRKNYESDPKVKERKKKNYAKDKKRQTILEKKQEMEWNKTWAKELAISSEKSARDLNKTHFESNEWIHDFFMHFFETFKEVCNQTKERIITLKKSLDRVYIINEFKIDELADKANVAADDYNGEYPRITIEISAVNAKLRTQRHDQKKTIEIKLKEIADQVEESDKGSDWYRSLKRLNEIYVDRKRSMRPLDSHFLNEKFCIICKDRSHRISFDPEHDWYTYYGTSASEKKYMDL